MSRVVHFGIPADDPERSIKFYKTVFGWNFEKWDGPIEYWLVMTGPEDQPGIDGGQVIRPKMAVPGVGWMAYIKDTEGNIFGLMESDPGAK